jgi:hypothetical protein
VWNRSRVGLIVLCAALVAQVSRLGALAPLLLGGVLVVGNVVTLRWRQWRSTPTGPDLSRLVGTLAGCWLWLILVPAHSFVRSGYRPSGPRLDTEALVQLAGFAGVALVALTILRTLEPTPDRLRPPLLLFLLPLWTVVSSLWSETGAYAFARGWMMATTSLVAWVTVALGRVDPAAVEAVVAAVMRWFVRITLVLVALGVLFGPLYVSASEANLERFTWLGAHPLLAGIVLSVALVVVCTTSASALRVPQWVRALMGAAFLAALVPNHSRQMWLALAVVLVLALALQGRLTPVFRWVGAPLLGAAVVAGVMFWGPEIWDYLLRNDDSDQLSTGNGRLALWGIGFRALDSPFDLLFGLGHGVTRTLFVAEEPWAHSAHSSFLAALVSLGVIGLCVFVVVLAVTARDLSFGRVWSRSATGMTLTLLFALVLIHGVVADNLVIPNFDFAVLYLIAAVAMVQRWVPVEPVVSAAFNRRAPGAARSPGSGREPAR